MSRSMVVIIHFNTWLTDPDNPVAWTKEWIDYRIDVFMKYTYNSFIAQTSQDFLALILYADQTKELVQSALSRHPELPEHIRFLPFSATRKHIYDYIEGSEEFYLTTLGSDDMYHRTMIQQLYDAKPKPDTEVIINQLGYCYDAENQRLATWRHESPPFHTLVYRTEDYLTGKRYKVVGGHPGAIKLKHETIADRYNYVVVIHGQNVSTRFSGTDIIEDREDVQRIMQEFGGVDG